MARRSRLPLGVFARYARRRAITLLMRDLFNVTRVAAVILSQVKNRLTRSHHAKPGHSGAVVESYGLPALFPVPTTGPPCPSSWTSSREPGHVLDVGPLGRPPSDASDSG